MTKALPSTAKLMVMVEAVRETLDQYKGLKMSLPVSWAAANAVKHTLPWAPREMLRELLYCEMTREREIDGAMIEERSRNIVQALTGGIE